MPTRDSGFRIIFPVPIHFSSLLLFLAQSVSVNTIKSKGKKHSDQRGSLSPVENRCIYMKCHLHRNISESGKFNQKKKKKKDSGCQNSLLLIQRTTHHWAILIWWILKGFSIQVICSVQFSNSKFWRSDERKQIILVWAVREKFFKNKPTLQKSLRNVGQHKINLFLLCLERLHLIHQKWIFNSEVNFLN